MNNREKFGEMKTFDIIIFRFEEIRVSEMQTEIHICCLSFVSWFNAHEP